MFKKRLLSGLLALLMPLAVQAQSVPASNPTYIPSAILSPVTLSAPGTMVFYVQGTGTAVLRVAGTYTGLAATVQGSTDRTASPSWSNLGIIPMGAGSPQGALASLSKNGLYKIDLTGLAQIQVNVSALSTGSVTLSMSSDPAAGVVRQSFVRRATYSASFVGLVPAASATDFLTITGNATTVTRISRVACSGTSTAAATALIEGVIRSTADTAGTSTTATNVAADTSDGTSLATVKGYTANPTLGTLTGIVRAGNLTTNTVASSAFANVPLVWTFGREQVEELTLRGATQVFALNANGASFTAGTSLNCDVQWTEE